MSWTKKQAWKLRLSTGGPIRRHMRLLQKTQFLPEPDLLDLQRERTRAILRHAYDATPFYRRVLGKAGVVDRTGTVDLNRLPEVPLLDKTIIHNEFEALKSADLAKRRWRVRMTGGSSGEPARFVQDVQYTAWDTAMMILWDSWTGYEMGDRKVVLWGMASDLDGSPASLRETVGSWLRNRVRMRAFPVTEEELLSYARIINDYRPVQLFGYVETTYELALAIQRAGIHMNSPRSIMTGAGALYPTMRTAIEGAFGVPVFDHYGSTEVGAIACQCDRHQGMHVGALSQRIEILGPDGCACDPGEEGEIVITNLTNYAMPLIRYRIGDTGAWATEPCACGRKGPLLARVTGRVHDIFVCANGTQVDGKYFLWLLDHVPWIQRFRVVQEAIDDVRIFLQPYRDPSEEERRQLDEIRASVRHVMGPSCRVTLSIVPDIAASPSGKHLYIISKVRSLEDVRR